MNQKKIEDAMDEYLVKKAPFQIPENGRKAIVEWLPWISVVVGVISLLAGLGLWRAAHAVNRFVDYTNSWLSATGNAPISGTRSIGFVFYVALAVILIQGVLSLYAYAGLKARNKAKGWNVLLLITLLNLLYGILVFFSSYGDFGNIIGSLIGALIGLYLLAQIRGYYGAGGATKSVNTAKKPTANKK